MVPGQGNQVPDLGSHARHVLSFEPSLLLTEITDRNRDEGAESDCVSDRRLGKNQRDCR